ncbi:MAG TPA: sigma-70 family RNA polymerase sigma factor [Vicinamibacteria bacterium]|nr:sigma-70 family RNA polymerase sigma factor [Vicinamibacteria bacterium]
MPTAAHLFERHHLAVFRFLRRMGLPQADAEDLTQDVFLRIVQALPSYEERESERAWVFRIARNLRLDRWRASGRAPATEPLGEEKVVAIAAARVDALAIEQALGRLGEAEREALVMREVGGLSYAEIAEATGATPDAVRSRIHRARLFLRRTLGGARRPSRAGAGREA